MPPSTAPFDAVNVNRLRARRTVKWSLYGPEVLAAWVAEMDFDVAPVIRAALIAAIGREDFGYLAADSPELLNACSRFLGEAYAWEVPPSRIFPVADVSTGIAGALDVFVPEGAPVVVPTPAYPPFFEIIELGGRRPVQIPMVLDEQRLVLDLDEIDAALAGGARAVLLCNPQNPTGRAFDAVELGALAAIVQRHGARVIADEVHAPLVHAGHSHTPYATVSREAAEHSITVTSASKAWNIAGLRCAQVIATNHADAAAWRTLPVHKVAGPIPLGVAASAAAYGEGVPWLHDLRAYLDRNRQLLGELLAAELPGITYRIPDATFLAWLDCTELGIGDPARFFLDEAGVALSDGADFGIWHAGHVRLNFGTSRALLEQIVDQMGAAVRGR